MIGFSRSPVNKGYDRDNGFPGIMGPTGAEWPGTTGAVQANRAAMVRIVPSRLMRIKSIRFVVTTAASVDDSCQAGIYDSEFKRLVASEVVTGRLNSTGVKTVNIAETILEPNKTYFLVLSVGAIGGTAAVLVSVNNNSGFAGDIFASAGASFRMLPFANASHPLPEGPLAISGSSVNPWLVGSEV